MTWLCRACLVGLTLPAVATAQTELGRASMFGKDVILFDDHTWAFADPSVGTPMALTGDACFQTGEGRLTFCPPDLWTERSAIFSEYGTEVFLSGGETNHILTVYLDESYGHAGAYDVYETLGPVGDFLFSAMSRAMGLAEFQEFSVIQDEIVLVSHMSVDDLSGYTSVSLQIMTEAQSLWVDLETQFLIDGSDVAASEHDPELVDIVTAAILIDDIPLPQWLEKAEGTE